MNSNELRFAKVLWTSLGTPLSLRLIDAMERGDWDTIVKTRIHPASYTHSYAYLKDAVASGLLRKAADIPSRTAVEKRREALRTFWEGEQSCKLTNRRLSPYLTCEGVDWDPEVNRHLEGIRKVVKRVLGTPPKREQIVGRHGPGATFSDPAKRSTAGDKMNSRPSMTPRFAKTEWWGLWELTSWGRACFSATSNRWPSYTYGGRFATAPKDATKDRPIEAGPSINVFYQLGVGRAMRARLKRVGIDLNQGQAAHKDAARCASLDGKHATLDLKNASGTVSKVLVRLLIPADWLTYLEELRSSHVTIEKQLYYLEQFSGMGNGYTFELETLIFYAISTYCMEHFGTPGKAMVYGDDIIVPTEIVAALVPLLRFLGFQTNEEKSFSEGPFRESCGGDYFLGQSVRPFHLKEIALDSPEKVIAAANGLRACLQQHPALWAECKQAWFVLLDLLPRDVRTCRGPKDLGDICIHDEFDRWNRRNRNGIRYIKVYRPVSRGFWPTVNKGRVPIRFFDDDVQLALALSGVADSGQVSNSRAGVLDTRYREPAVLPRDSVTGYKVGWSAFS